MQSSQRRPLGGVVRFVRGTQCTGALFRVPMALYSKRRTSNPTNLTLMLKNFARYGATLAFAAALLSPLAASASVVGLASSAPPAPGTSSALSVSQINAIMSLLRAFGADQSVIANVQASLTGTPAPTNAASCVNLSYSLYTGQTDASTNGDVTRLQNFLTVTPIGYFGPQTEQAVQRWQSAHGIVSSGSPDTTGYGLVGPQTSEAMGCGSGNQNQNQPSSNFSATPTSGTAPLTVTFVIPDSAGGAYINFGDGKDGCSLSGVVNNGMTGCSVPKGTYTHTYTHQGTYHVVLSRLMPATVLGTTTITVTGGISGAPNVSVSNISGSAVTVNYANMPSGATFEIFPYPMLSGTTPVFKQKFSQNGSPSGSNDVVLPAGTQSTQYYVVAVDSAGAAIQAKDASGNTYPVSTQFTILSLTSGVPSATLDQNSLTSNSAHPTITGTASNVHEISVGIKGSIGGTAIVVNGRWAVTIQDTLSNGTYGLQIGDDDNNTVLTNGTLTVTGSQPNQPTTNGTMPTTAQISSEVRLLQSFGASLATIENVQAALGVSGAQFNSSVPASVTQPQHDAVISLLHSWGIFPSVITAVDNALPVLPSTVKAVISATIDQSSLTSYAGTAVLTGAAANTTAVRVAVNSEAGGASYYTSGFVSVINGRWTATVSPALASGVYRVVVTDYTTGAQLATGDLIIGMALPAQSASLTLVSPVSASTYVMGASVPFVWTYKNLPSNSHVVLSVAVTNATGSGFIGGMTAQTLTPLSGSGTVSYTISTGPSRLDIPGTYTVTAKVRACGASGCSSYYPSDESLPVYATTPVQTFTLVPAAGASLGAADLSIQSMTGANVVVHYAGAPDNATLRITGPGSSNAIVSSEGITSGSGIIGAALPLTAPAGDYLIYVADATGSGVTSGVSFYYGGSSGVDVLNSLVSAGSPFTLHGSSTYSGQLHLLAMSSAYSLGVDYATASSHLKDGSGVYAPINNSVAMSGTTWSANFNTMPEANYRLSIYDSSYKLIGTALLMVSSKG